MKIYTLDGLTKRGKQLVKQHGSRWECTQTEDTVLFSLKRGPWMLLSPLDEQRTATTPREARHESAARWVHALTDENFKVMP
jgi:hypothetical protein